MNYRHFGEINLCFLISQDFFDSFIQRFLEAELYEQ
jgi:hypothetical protein